MNKEETYRKVFINGDESKLPKDGYYIIMFNRNYIGLSDDGLRHHKINRESEKYGNSVNEWIEHVDWYLLPTNDKAIIAKMEELIYKKSQIVSNLIKIILRNGSKIILRVWESDYIHKYSETYRQLEQDLEELKKTQ